MKDKAPTRAVMASVLLAAAMLVAPAISMADEPFAITIYIPNCDNDADYALRHAECSEEQRQRARLQQQQRERDAQGQRAEQARKDALIAAEVRRLGSHRADEARRLVEMREAALAARGRPGAAATTESPPTIQPPRKCEQTTLAGSMNSQPEGASLLFTGFRQRPEAEGSLRNNIGRFCTARTGQAGASLSHISCDAEGGRWNCSARYTCSAPGTGNCSNSQ